MKSEIRNKAKHDSKDPLNKKVKRKESSNHISQNSGQSDKLHGICEKFDTQKQEDNFTKFLRIMKFKHRKNHLLMNLI